MRPLYCSRCRRPIGLSRTSVSVVCSTYCVRDFWLERYEDRNAVIALLSRIGWTVQRIAQKFGLSKQRVHTIVERRS